MDSKNVTPITIKEHLPQMSHPDINGNFHVISELASQTFKCKNCHSKFTVAITPHKGQNYHQINHALFLLLINKESFSRCMEVLNISMENIYQRIKFFYKQCIQFDQYHLKENLPKLNDKTLNLSMDRQHFYSNWSDKSDKRRSKIVNISTIDNSSRFVLASTLNFDFTSDYKKLRREFIRIGEYTKYQEKRRYPQYVLPEEIDDNDPSLKPPVKNLLLQQTYSMMAHIEYLKLYFDELKHINLFADNDSGFEMSITRVCADLIKNKKLTCALIRDSKLKDKDETEKEGCYYWIKQENPVVKNNFIDLKFLTSYTQYNVTSASLYGIDSYFQLNRRRISMVERPVPTSTKTEKQNKEKIKADEDKKQIWNLYGSYNPKYVSMLIEILRVYNNYILTDKKSLSRTSMKGKTPKTPAQKIGLVEQPFSVHDILEFSPAKVFLDKRDIQKVDVNLA